MAPDTPECHAAYDRAREIFYTHFTYLFAEQGGPIHREEVPYADGVLPCWRIVPADTSKGAILFHGGNDSLLEEFTDALLYLAQGGYTVLAFEGPGQGAALRKSGLTFTPEWEKPVGAVLDLSLIHISHPPPCRRRHRTLPGRRATRPHRSKSGAAGGR